MWVLIPIGALLLILLLFGYTLFVAFKLSNGVSVPKFGSRDDRKKENHKNGYDEGSESFQRKETIFIMPDGYQIHGDVSINNPNKFILLCHGHGSTREGTMKYATLFWKLGYSVVMYDHRSHGDNQKQYVTMGYKEANDAYEITKQIKNKYGKHIELGVFGVSMGAATALLLTQYKPEIKFIIADCAYSSLKNQMKDVMRSHHACPFICMPTLNLVFKLRYHFSLKDVEPVNVLKENNIPVLFIHGDKDSFVLPYNVELLYAANKGAKDIIVFPNGTHGKSIDSDRKTYEQKVESFINGPLLR